MHFFVLQPLESHIFACSIDVGAIVLEHLLQMTQPHQTKLPTLRYQFISKF